PRPRFESFQQRAVRREDPVGKSCLFRESRLWAYEQDEVATRSIRPKPRYRCDPDPNWAGTNWRYLLRTATFAGQWGRTRARRSCGLVALSWCAAASTRSQ